MINTEPKDTHKIELSQKKQIEHQLIGRINPFNGHTIWEINNKTLEIKKAEYSTVMISFDSKTKKGIIKQNGFSYVSALNEKNALKKYRKGDNGSKRSFGNTL